jgi:metal-responsive CopG/Arc/MetJ family transcriptional regulator
MRTTVSLDDDVVAAVEEVRRDQHVGLSEAINELIRRGLSAQTRRPKFRQRTAAMGISIDVANVAEALDLLEGPTAR